MSTGEIMDPSGMHRSMLRWYPAPWRARYGDEFIAMVEDDLDGRPPGIPYRWAVARSGVVERLREAGLHGDSVPPEGQMRGGALAVLCAFGIFVIPGVAFAKISEHWDESIHRGSRHLPALSFNLLGSLAVACGLAVLVAMGTLLPNLVHFLRTGGWPAIRRPVLWAASVTSVAVVLGAGLVVWAHQLTTHQRNSGFGGSQFLFAVVAMLLAASIVTWAAAAVGITRRLAIGPAQLKVLGVLAVAVAACMPLMTAAATALVGNDGHDRSLVPGRHPGGKLASPLSANLLGVLIMMTFVSAAGIFGLLRVIGSWHTLQAVSG